MVGIDGVNQFGNSGTVHRDRRDGGRLPGARRAGETHHPDLRRFQRPQHLVAGRPSIRLSNRPANAGVLWLGPVESTPLKRWQLCLDVHLTGVFLVTREAIPYLRARGGGSLIAVTTTGVNMTDRGSNAYWVSTAAVERLYLGLAADLRPDNIAVNCLSPSRVVLTEGWQAAGGGDIPADMVEPPETMGRAAALLAAQDATGITGTVQR
ncbi:SDR family oxidoreductase [Nocardia sp. NPDC002869]|uniref:SDR family oxidoreductase n=1 Tax=Nocardia sp. NPDC002869 TaxID=3161032 RepID=UPI00398CD5EE